MKHKMIAMIFFLIVFIHQGQLDAADNTTEMLSSNLPLVVIDTHGKEIPYDNPRLVADMGIIDNGPGRRNQITDSFNDYDGKIAIEIRGSSSAGWLKKSYGFETQDDGGNNLNVSLLKFPEENDWVLYGPYYDRSLMRNVLVCKISRQMGWYASRTRYCELVLNNVYKGIYVLMEKIKRDKKRVNIASLGPYEISGDDLTGGYIIKIDKEPWNEGFDSVYPPYTGAWQKIRYQYHEPDPDAMPQVQKNYIHQFVNEFETIMSSSLYRDAQSGYTKYLNVESFVDNFLLNELSRNVDAYRLSSFFYKDKDSKGGKLTAGPVWDCNFSFGNIAYYGCEFTDGWNLDYLTQDAGFKSGDYWQVPFWWKKLVADPLFANRLRMRWNELRHSILDIGTLHGTIDAIADTLNEAKDRNFQIWIGPGDPPAPGDGWFPPSEHMSHLETYEDELNFLKTWMDDRIQWIDDNIFALVDIAGRDHSMMPGSFSLQQNYPNPFNATTQIRFQLPETEFIELVLYCVDGSDKRTLLRGILSAGLHECIVDAGNLSSGIYLYSLKGKHGLQLTKQMVIIK